MPEITPDIQWTNWLGLLPTMVTRVVPRSHRELEAWMRARTDLRSLRIRAAGAGHSTSSVARPEQGGFVVDLGRAALDFEAEAEGWWKASLAGVEPRLTARDRIVRIPSGIRVHDANRLLASKGLALENVGSFDAQHVIGNIATATHGSGLATGAACDFVMSIEMLGVASDPVSHEPRVQGFRIEPTAGITDPARFAAARALHGMELIQKDETFYSVVVGLGAFGIVTALTLRVVPAFWLIEDHRFLGWSELAPELATLSRGTYFDFSMTPYDVLRGGRRDRWCLATTRHPIPSGDKPPPRDDVRARKLSEQVEKFHRLGSADPKRAATQHLAFAASRYPRAASASAADSFAEEASRNPPGQLWSSASYIVFRTSVADYVYATSSEMAVPIESAARAVKAVVAQVEKLREKNLFHTSPFGVRFQRASKHYLAPQYGRETCTIEAPLLVGPPDDGRTGTEANDQILRGFRDALSAAGIDGRPHWGQRNGVTFQDAQRMYPRFASWLVQYRRFNRYGTFNSGLLRALGIEM